MKKMIIFLAIIPCLLCSCGAVQRKTLLQWCLWEIHKHENYDCEWAYSYNTVYSPETKDNLYIKCYVITTYTDDRVGEWFCFIERYNHSNHIVDTYAKSDIKLIDCDLFKETFYD